jgi:DNA-binding response OmpR family regulator
VSQKSVLLIDDSATARATLTDRLEKVGYVVTSAADGREGLRRLYDTHPDVVLLDVVMPGIDGWKTLELIRDVSEVPVIMLTSRDTELERVRGLRGGADDYVGKPFSPSELTARIEAVLRRAREKEPAKERFDDEIVSIDFAAREVTVRGEQVSLTPLEFRLLAVLTEHAGQVLSRQQLIDLVWGQNYSSSGDPVKIYIGYLRRKIERVPAKPELVETVRGFGYRYRKNTNGK